MSFARFCTWIGYKCRIDPDHWLVVTDTITSFLDSDGRRSARDALMNRINLPGNGVCHASGVDQTSQLWFRGFPYEWCGAESTFYSSPPFMRFDSFPGFHSSIARAATRTTHTPHRRRYSARRASCSRL